MVSIPQALACGRRIDYFFSSFLRGPFTFNDVGSEWHNTPSMETIMRRVVSRKTFSPLFL
jgi:hypothetical protein